MKSISRSKFASLAAPSTAISACNTETVRLYGKSCPGLCHICPALLMLCLLLASTSARAEDGCATIGDDPQWKYDLSVLVETIQAGEIQAAKQQAKALSAVCGNAPTLNYLQGKIAEALDDKSEALYYYQKASENTFTFAVDPDIAKKIWYARYEAEHPERTQGAVTSKSEHITSLESQVSQLNATLASQYRKFMWLGIGLGTGGLVLAGTGAALVAKFDPVELGREDNHKLSYKEKPLHSFGWASIGVGTGLLVTGAVLAGIYGYRYSRAKQDDLTFYISPSSIMIHLTF